MIEWILQPGPLLLGEAAPGQLYITVPQLLAVALLAGGVIMLSWAFRRGGAGSGGSGAGGGAGGGEIDRTAPPRGLRHGEGHAGDPLGSTMADARELSDLLADRLDRQAHRLERLLADADDRIRRLERLNSGGAAAERNAGSGPSKPESDPLNRRVYELADTGLPPVEIARTLQQHTGKVELILALRRR